MELELPFVLVLTRSGAGPTSSMNVWKKRLGPCFASSLTTRHVKESKL